MPTSTEVAIATTTLSSAAASITFSSIPATYTDLRVVLVGTTDVGYFLDITLNNATSGYSVTNLLGDGNSASSSRETSQAKWKTPSLTSTTIPTMFTLDLFSYSGSTYKTGLVTGSNDVNTGGRVARTVGLFQSTSAISSIKFESNFSGALFNVGTTATLYGIL